MLGFIGTGLNYLKDEVHDIHNGQAGVAAAV
jgi:hypothetical protein